MTSTRILLSLPLCVAHFVLLTYLSLTYLPFPLLTCAVALLILSRLNRLEDSWRAYTERKRARAAGLADSPSTTPLTRDYRFVLSELERIARDTRDARETLER